MPWFAGQPQLDVTPKRLYDPKDWMSEEERARLAGNSKGIGAIANWEEVADWAVFSVS